MHVFNLKVVGGVALFLTMSLIHMKYILTYAERKTFFLHGQDCNTDEQNIVYVGASLFMGNHRNNWPQGT